MSICRKICYHSELVGIAQDIGFAEIQRWFNVYAFDDPMFYQTSEERITSGELSQYFSTECLDFQKEFFIPRKLII
jgi:hypothetical protein